MTGAENNSGTLLDESYSYDENGNRIIDGTTGQTVTDNNRLTSDGTWTYEFDDEGNRTAKVSIATSERVDYEWDHRNRLAKVVFKTGGTVTKTVTQTYDIYNRWVKSVVDSNGPAAGGESQRVFIYDGDQVVIEFDGTSGQDISHRYLWAPGIDHLLADEQVTTPTAAGNTIWPLGDHLNTARDLVDYNFFGSTTNHRAYNSFGELTSESNAAVDLVFGFAGRAEDDNTGLTNKTNRWYDSVTGRFIGEDPIGFKGGDPNLARYVGNSPLDFVDPSGLSWFLPESRGPRRHTRGAILAELAADTSNPVHIEAQQMQQRYREGYEVAKKGQDMLGKMTPGLGLALAAHEAATGSDMHGDKINTTNRVLASAQVAVAALPCLSSLLDGVGDLFASARSTLRAVDKAADNAPPRMTGGINNLGPSSLLDDGLPVRNLTTNRIKVTGQGIDVVEGHLSRFGGPFSHNEAMLSRLRRIAAGEIQATPQDLNFYAHELREFVRMRNLGVGPQQFRAMPESLQRRIYESVHNATLMDYQIVPGTEAESLYHAFARQFIGYPW